MKDTLGSRLRAARDGKGWTLDELAKRSNVSKATLSRVETAGRSLTIEKAAAICDALGISLDALAGRTVSPTSRKRTTAVAKAQRLAMELAEHLERLD